jgi:hypothetical protein
MKWIYAQEGGQWQRRRVRGRTQDEEEDNV